MDKSTAIFSPTQRYATNYRQACATRSPSPKL
jgi:hypothetical protein